MVKRGAAAALLGVSPGVLEAWGERFGFPRPMLVQSDEPLYSRRQLSALSDALETGLSIPAAIAEAQDALAAAARLLTAELLPRSAGIEGLEPHDDVA